MEEMNIEFVIAAYSIAWVVILGYLVRLVRKGSHARVDYDRMASEHTGEALS